MTEEHVQTRTWTSARLHVVLGERSVDIAVPAEVPLVDLLPAVLPQFGAEAVEAGAEHEGWVVQRLGEPPLDEDLTLVQLDLQDGETVHLRPRSEQLAPVDYDDVVAGVGEQVRAHPSAWTPARTRGMLLTGAAALLLLAVPLLVGAGGGAAPGLIAAMLAVLLLVGAALVARGAADPQVATTLAGVAAVHAATAGALLSLALTPYPTVSAVLTCAAAAGVAALAVGLVVVADAALLFTGALTFGAVVTLTGLVGSVGALSVAATAAVILTLTLVAAVFVPSAAFRLSGLTLPLLPTTAEELTEDITPVPHALVVERGAATVGYAAALQVGFGAAQLPLLLAAASGGGWATAFALVAALLLFLRSRHPDGAVSRWSMLVPAAGAVVAGVLSTAAGADPSTRLMGLLLPVLAAGGLLLWLVDTLPGRRLRPYWGRGVDILESLTAIALVPLLLAVLGVYAWMRGLGG